MPELRERRRREAELAMVTAATELFLREGYAKTTMTAVAELAGVAERSVYVHFDSKAKLYQRVIEAATVGDIDGSPLPERDWSRRAMSEPTLAARIEAFADGVSTMHERLGPLMAVNGEVEPSEPAVQESAGAAREATVVFLRSFWESADVAGLLPAGADIPWLVHTSAILSAAETRLVITRHLSWERDSYRDWLVTTWWRMLAGSAS